MPRDGNRENPGKGRSFQEGAKTVLSRHFGVEFRTDVPVQIGDPPKGHRFDLASKDLRHVGECKNYSWTESGNVPSAKMAFVNEAVFYLSYLPEGTRKLIVMRRDKHPKHNETLAEYYYRTYRHLLKGVSVLELDLETSTVREISR